MTAHDGFTLRDLVSYNGKHNEANNEGNRDGTENNNSWNCGAEGPTEDPEINRLRNRQIRNFLATLMLSQGVPMLVAGDEFGRSQGGNNNAYCQDSEISWLDWEGLDDEGRALLEFTRKVIALRRNHIVFHRDHFFRGKIIPGTDVKDVVWLTAAGQEMSEDDWKDGNRKAVAVRLSGEAGLTHLSERGEQELDDTFLVLINASHENVVFTVTDPPLGTRWEVVLDTTADDPDDFVSVLLSGGEKNPLGPISLRLLIARAENDAPGSTNGQNQAPTGTIKTNEVTV